MGHPDSYFSSLGQEELFYNRPHDNSNGLMPSYRTHPRMRTIDIPGKDTRILGWLTLWLLSFKLRSTKLDIFLAKNQQVEKENFKSFEMQ